MLSPLPDPPPVVRACVLVSAVVAVDRERCLANSSPRTFASVRCLWRAAAFVAFVRLWTALVVVPNLSVDDRTVWHATHDRMQREAAASSPSPIDALAALASGASVGHELDETVTGEAAAAAATADNVWRQLVRESGGGNRAGPTSAPVDLGAAPIRDESVVSSAALPFDVDAIRPSTVPPPPPPPPPPHSKRPEKRRRKTLRKMAVEAANRDNGVVSVSTPPAQIVADILRYIAFLTAVVVTVDALSTPDSILKRIAPGAESTAIATSVVCVVAWIATLAWPFISGGSRDGTTTTVGDATADDYRTAATASARVHVLDALIIVAAACREYSTAAAQRHVGVEARRVEQHVSRRQQRRNAKISVRKTERAANAQSRNPKRHQCADANCRH